MVNRNTKRTSEIILFSSTGRKQNNKSKITTKDE